MIVCTLLRPLAFVTVTAVIRACPTVRVSRLRTRAASVGKRHRSGVTDQQERRNNTATGHEAKIRSSHGSLPADWSLLNATVIGEAFLHTVV